MAVLDGMRMGITHIPLYSTVFLCRATGGELEAHPLDSMTMVGSVAKQGQPYALLRVDKLLYQVKVGDYLGQNYGKITKISETDVSFREIVQDAAGEWIERMSALQLQEKAR